MDQQFCNFESLYSSSDFPYILPQQTFPVKPTNPYNNNETSSAIDKIVEGYHNPQWIHIQDCIHYMDDQEYLKRSYSVSEQKTKIQLLGQYYRYHIEAPRIFNKQVFAIIQENTDDKRAIQYALVTEQMKDNEEDNLLRSTTTNRIAPHHKIIKDIELSYDNFEEKPIQRSIPVPNYQPCKIKMRGEQKQITTTNRYKENQQKNRKNMEKDKDKKGMTRTTSIKSKGEFYIFRNMRESTNNNQKTNDCMKKQRLESKKVHDNSKNKKPMNYISSRNNGSKNNKSKNCMLSSQNNFRKSIILVNNQEEKKQKKDKNIVKQKSSKINSTNTSVVSSGNNNNKTLSRSQSRAQLNTIQYRNKGEYQNKQKQYKKIGIKNNAKFNNNSKVQTQASRGTNQKKTINSRATSKQNSLQNSILKENNQKTNKAIYRQKDNSVSQSKNILQNSKQHTIRQNIEINKKRPQISNDKRSKLGLCEKKDVRKMFNKAIQIKKKKQY